MPNDLEQRAYERQQKLSDELSSLLAADCPAQQLIDKHEEWQQAINQWLDLIGHEIDTMRND